MEPATDVEQSGEENRSTGELVKQLSEQVTTLIRDELKLAQVEMTNKGKQLGGTVEQLVAKADVMARAKGKAADLAGQVKGQAGQVKTQAAARAGTVRDQLASNSAGVRQRAVQLRTMAKGQASAAAAPVWQATPELARQAVAKGAGAARQHRVPLAVAASALIVGLLVTRWWRKR